MFILSYSVFVFKSSALTSHSQKNEMFLRVCVNN